MSILLSVCVCARDQMEKMKMKKQKPATNGNEIDKIEIVVVFGLLKKKLKKKKRGMKLAYVQRRVSYRTYGIF